MPRRRGNKRQDFCSGWLSDGRCERSEIADETARYIADTLPNPADFSGEVPDLLRLSATLG